MAVHGSYADGNEGTARSLKLLTILCPYKVYHIRIQFLSFRLWIMADSELYSSIAALDLSIGSRRCYSVQERFCPNRTNEALKLSGGKTRILNGCNCLWISKCSKDTSEYLNGCCRFRVSYGSKKIRICWNCRLYLWVTLGNNIPYLLRLEVLSFLHFIKGSTLQMRLWHKKVHFWNGK